MKINRSSPLFPFLRQCLAEYSYSTFFKYRPNFKLINKELEMLQNVVDVYYYWLIYICRKFKIKKL